MARDINRMDKIEKTLLRFDNNIQVFTFRIHPKFITVVILHNRSDEV